MRFSLPYTPGLLDYVESLTPDTIKSIHDVYFSDPLINPTARHFSDIDFVDQMWIDLKLMKSRYNIKMNYTMNPSVWKNDVYLSPGKQILIDNLIDIYTRGCDMLTFNNLMLLRDIDFRENIPDFAIKLSINNKVSTLDEVEFLHEHVQLNNFILDRSVNRNLDEIIRIHEWTHDKGISLTLLGQEGCITKCPFKQTCDNMISTFHDYDIHEVNDIRLQHSQKFCDSHYNDNPADMLKSPWISPAGLVIYEPYIDYIKLAGRGVDIDSLKVMLGSYLHQKSDTSLSDIFSSHHIMSPIKTITVSELEEKGFSHQVSRCKNQCSSCNFCDKIYESIINDN